MSLLRASTCIGFVVWAFAVNIASGKSPEPSAERASFEQVSKAISRGLKIVERGAENYPKHRQCFSCHHQTLPMLAIREARTANLDGSKQVLKSQAAFTLASFKSRADDLRKGEQIGGRAMTVGYGLWALREAEHPADETTDAMVEYLLKTQDPSGCWIPQTDRPPLEISRIAATAIAVFGIQQFGGHIAPGSEIERALDKAERWLATAPRRDHEDLVFARWSEKLFDDDSSRSALSGNTERKEALTREVFSTQRADGGWAQKSDMQSDAYATGQSLWLLRQIGVSTSEPAIQRAAAFLINTQKPDGSWLVETRSKPIQKLFDNGDPHGKSQFISIAATGWGVAALAATLVDSNTDRYLGNPTIQLVEHDARLDITIGGRKVASYVYRDPSIKRPYFANLKVAAGDIEISRRHPPTAYEATDHETMHPGLWLAFGDLSGEDFWRNRGRVVHEKFIEITSGNDVAHFVVQNRYESEDGKHTIARENCRWTIDARHGLLYLCDSTFTPVEGDLYFGDQEEMGLGIRLTSPLTVKNGGSLRDSEGRSGESQVWGKTAKWCDCRGVIDGVHVGAIVMPDPKNFRPSWFHARDYGLLVANPFGQNAFTKGEKSKVRVAKGESLRLRFGVLLHTAGSADAFKPETAYDDFLKAIAELSP